MSDEDTFSRPEDRRIERALEAFGHQLEEVWIKDQNFKVPREMIPENKANFGTNEGWAIIEESLIALLGSAFRVKDDLKRLDPEFYGDRLNIFFEEWEKAHQGWDLRIFNNLKELLQATY